MYAFIGGTPAAGKSYVAKKFIAESKLKIEYIDIDSYRKNFARDPKLEYWVNFFNNQDELNYWQEISPDDHLKNLIAQSETFWPEIMKIVNSVRENNEHAIFEAVNLLPHLTHKDFDFPGFFLIEDDFRTLLEKLRNNPRWGKTLELQKLEAKFFIEVEGKYIKKEATKYDYPVFNNSDDSLMALKEIFN